MSDAVQVRSNRRRSSELSRFPILQRQTKLHRAKQFIMRIMKSFARIVVAILCCLLNIFFVALDLFSLPILQFLLIICRHLCCFCRRQETIRKFAAWFCKRILGVRLDVKPLGLGICWNSVLKNGWRQTFAGPFMIGPYPISWGSIFDLDQWEWVSMLLIFEIQRTRMNPLEADLKCIDTLYRIICYLFMSATVGYTFASYHFFEAIVIIRFLHPKGDFKNLVWERFDLWHDGNNTLPEEGHFPVTNMVPSLESVPQTWAYVVRDNGKSWDPKRFWIYRISLCALVMCWFITLFHYRWVMAVILIPLVVHVYLEDRVNREHLVNVVQIFIRTLRQWACANMSFTAHPKGIAVGTKIDWFTDTQGMFPRFTLIPHFHRTNELLLEREDGPSVSNPVTVPMLKSSVLNMYENMATPYLNKKNYEPGADPYFQTAPNMLLCLCQWGISFFHPDLLGEELTHRFTGTFDGANYRKFGPVLDDHGRIKTAHLTGDAGIKDSIFEKSLCDRTIRTYLARRLPSTLKHGRFRVQRNGWVSEKWEWNEAGQPMNYRSDQAAVDATLQPGHSRIFQKYGANFCEFHDWKDSVLKEYDDFPNGLTPLTKELSLRSLDFRTKLILTQDIVPARFTDWWLRLGDFFSKSIQLYLNFGTQRPPWMPVGGHRRINFRYHNRRESHYAKVFPNWSSLYDENVPIERTLSSVMATLGSFMTEQQSSDKHGNFATIILLITVITSAH